MDEAGRHHALRRGKEAMTTLWRSVQNVEKAPATCATSDTPVRFHPTACDAAKQYVLDGGASGALKPGKSDIAPYPFHPLMTIG